MISPRNDLTSGSGNQHPLPEKPKTTTTVSALPQAVMISIDDDFSDEIVFTSSAPESRSVQKSISRSKSGIYEDGDPTYETDEHFSLSQPMEARTHLSERTANLLASLNRGSTDSATAFKKATKTNLITTTNTASGKLQMNQISTIEDDILASSPPLPPPVTSKKRVKAPNSDAKSDERAMAKAAKEAAKEDEKERKRVAREQKVREKQLAADIAEVNKAKTDKKLSTREMILDVGTSFEGTSLGNQVTEFMKRLEVETGKFNTTIQPGNFVKWRRKVKARMNEELGIWQPITPMVQEEQHALCHLMADDFVKLVLASNSQSTDGDDKDLDSHVASMNGQFSGCKLIYLVEGLNSWMRKNRNNRNRAYQEVVHGQDLALNEQQNKRKRKGKSTAYVDEDSVEDALLQLQVKHDCLVYQTSCTTDSAEWIKNFTEHVSTIPYRQEKMNAQSDASFCMDVGQVKTGDDAKDTYVRMLQEVHRLTAPIAYGIANLYPSVPALITAFKQGGPAILEDVKKSANKNGGVTDARLGPSISKRLYKVFLGTNPSSTDI